MNIFPFLRGPGLVKRTLLVVLLAFGSPVKAVTPGDGPGGVGTTDGASQLELWVKADGLALANGAAVASWTDASGNGRTLVQGNAAVQPVFVTGVVGGKPVVRFTADHFGNVTLPSAGNEFTIVVVTKPTGIGAYHNIIDDQSGARPMLWIDPSRRYEFNFGSGAVAPAGSGYDVVFAVKRNSGPQYSQLYLNGPTVTAAGPSNFAVPASQSYAFFNRSGGQRFTGDVAEVIIYSTALTSVEIGTIGSYLQQKYALGSSFPALAPVVTTQAAGAVGTSVATLNASANPNGAATNAFFQYSTVSDLSSGVTTTAHQAIGSGTSAVAVSQAVSGLLPLTTYYFRASATNSAGTTNDGILSFTTLATPPTVVTLSATGVVPTSALLNGTVNPNGGSTDVRFQYSTDPGLAGATLTPLQNIGAGIAAVPVSAALTGLVPKTTYYFRAVGTNSGGTVNGAILSFTTNVVNWGGGGSDPTTGILDPTLIPTSGTRTFTNVNGQGYNIVVTTSNLNAGGGASYFGDSGWWFEGGGPSYGYGTVTFRFYDTVTGNPYPVSGVDFRLLDAERDERFRGFGYWDASNSLVPVAYGTGRLTFSHTPIYHATDGSYDNNAAREGGNQLGKWVEFNLADLAVTGFTFQAHRQISSAGSVIMGDLISPFAAWRSANFGPIPYPLTADDFANPDNDGPVNVIEYFYGTNPNIADNPNPQVMSIIANRLAITFPRSVAATDATATVEGADSAAGPWTGLARSINGAPFTTLVPNANVVETGAGLIRTVEVQDEYLTTDPLHPMRFLRLRVVH